MTQVCLNCHSTAKQKGDLDLERFASLEDVRRDTKVWLKVAEMLDNGEMPPKEAQQPTAAERKQLRGWVERYLHAESLAQAGDPGPGRAAAVEQCRVHLHDPRPDRRRPQSGPRFPDRRGRRRGLHQHGQRPGDVAGPAHEVLRRGARDRSTRRALAGRLSLLAVDLAGRLDERPPGPDSGPFIASTRTQAGASQVNLQGIVFNTNDGGRLPVERYLAATFDVADRLRRLRQASASERRPTASADADVQSSDRRGRQEGIAQRKVSRHPLGHAQRSRAVALARRHSGDTGGPLRRRTRRKLPRKSPSGRRPSGDSRASAISARSAARRPGRSRSHPIAAAQELRIKLPAPAAGEKVVTLYLVASDAGDGNANDFVDLAATAAGRAGPARLACSATSTISLAKCPHAASERLRPRPRPSPPRPRRHAQRERRRRGTREIARVSTSIRSPPGSTTWASVRARQSSSITLPTKVTKGSTYDFVQGWNTHDLPQLLANSSDQHVRVPGNMKPHSVCVHPSPTLFAAAGWRSPVAGTIEIDGKVTHAHPECGNGVDWWLELRRGATRQRLADGFAQGGHDWRRSGPIDGIAVQPGDLVSLLVGPRDGNHSCDLTPSTSTSTPAPTREWNLARDVSRDVLAGNPHADRFGNAGVWHFYTEPDKAARPAAVIPAGLAAGALAGGRHGRPRSNGSRRPCRQLLTSGPPAGADERPRCRAVSPARVAGRTALHARVGPAWRRSTSARGHATDRPTRDSALDPALFGKHPDGSADRRGQPLRSGSLGARGAPAGRPGRGTRVRHRRLARSKRRPRGKRAARGAREQPQKASGLLPICVTDSRMSSMWTDNKHRVRATPIVVSEGSEPAAGSRRRSTSSAASSPPPSATPRSCRSTRSSRSRSFTARTTTCGG